MKFKIILEKDEDNWYVATVPALPGCISQGKTENEAINNIKEAIELHMLKLSQKPFYPKPRLNFKISSIFCISFNTPNFREIIPSGTVIRYSHLTTDVLARPDRMNSSVPSSIIN